MARCGRAGQEAVEIATTPETLHYVRDILSDVGYAPVVTGEPDEISGSIRA